MKLLLLAGTAEARLLAQRLPGEGVQVVASLAGATRAPAGLPGEGVSLRIGGFGGEEEQEKYIIDNGFDAVLDATHPYAERIKARTARICARLGLPWLHLIRPAWQPGPGDRWHAVADASACARLIVPTATVFLATGGARAEAFRPLAPRRTICRRIDPAPAPFPWPEGRWLVARPGARPADEAALFARLGIDWLVCRNSGGDGARAKLEAARELGLPVAMLRRPAPPPGPVAETVTAALAWVARL